MHPKQTSSRLPAVVHGVRALAAALPLVALLPTLTPLVARGDAERAGTSKLSKASAWIASARAEPADAKGKVRYTCPMHPHYISDHAGTCPICGMDLVQMAGAEETGGKASQSRQIVTIAPEVVQNMGVRIAPAERASFGRQVRATAMVMENERTRSVMTARVEGWIEDLKITAVGDPVKKGMKLYELFAPELVVSQRDYLIAMRTRDRGRLEGTEARLRAFGVQDQVMQMLAQDGREMQRVPFFADRDGVVAELPVVSGEYLKRGATIMRVQDYTTVWMVVAVAEKDLGFLGNKARATVSFPSLSGRTFDTRIDYIYPTIDAKTRTGRVRLVVANADGLIRPGSFADVAFEIEASPRLAVRSEAVLLGARGAYAVVALGEGRFEPRALETGLVAGGWTEVRKGLADGEQVVVSGQFLIDSESTLNESFRKLERMQMPLHLLDLAKAELAMVDHMVDAAIYLHEALVDGYDVEPKFLQPARDIKDLLWPKFGPTKLGFVLEDAARAIGKAQSARSKSETESALAGLTEAIKPWMIDGVPRHYIGKKVALFKETGSARLWVQRGDRPVNPYGNGPAEMVPWPPEPSSPDGKGAAPSMPPAPPGSSSGNKAVRKSAGNIGG